MRVLLGLAVASLLVAACAATSDDSESDSADLKSKDSESTAAAKLESLRNSPDDLLTFLTGMPKGGDLHQHLTGGIYAESYITWAKADGLCVNTSNWDATEKSDCSKSHTYAMPATTSTLYKSVIDQWSMQDFVPSTHESGHDHFFKTFGRYGLVAAIHPADVLAEAASRAAADNEQYVELMTGMASTATGKVATATWTSSTELTQADFAAYHQKLLVAPGWSDAMASASTTLDKNEAGVQKSLACGTSAAKPGCTVELRYLYEADRAGQPHAVFAEFVAAFEIAMKDKRVVGVNLVGPEDGTVSLRDYTLHMQMLDYLHGYYAGKSPLHVALHAGEVTAGVLPAGDTNDLKSHIRQAVETGHAERIGHGVDVAGEDDSAGLVAELAQKNILVETCLTSNAVILLVSGTAHPLATYRAAGVPTALATDDPGVARSSMSKEYLRAVTDQKLGYLDLKQMARNSIEHSFLPGTSLWTNLANKTVASACAKDTLGSAKPSAACSKLLTSSEKATQEWALETRFATFEKAQ